MQGSMAALTPVSASIQPLHVELEIQPASAQRPPVFTSEPWRARRVVNTHPPEGCILPHTTLAWRRTALAERRLPRHAAIADAPIVSLPEANIQSVGLEIRCPFPRCNGKTFGRLYDYDRHHNGTHAEKPTVFWCDVVGCNRSEAEGGRPFPRKDKRNDHVRSVHEQ